MRVKLHIFLQQIVDIFHFFILTLGWKHIDNLTSMCPIFFWHWKFRISNFKLKYTFYFFIIYFFVMCLNGNISWFSLINILNRRLFWNYHFGEWWIFIHMIVIFFAMIFTNFGIILKTNLIILGQKWMICSAKTFSDQKVSINHSIHDV